jgi:hypothetical protein
MSFFKTSVSIPMFKTRLMFMFDDLSRGTRATIKGMDRSTPASQEFGKAIEGHNDGILAFGMQYAIKTYLKPRKQKTFLKPSGYGPLA